MHFRFGSLGFFALSTAVFVGLSLGTSGCYAGRDRQEAIVSGLDVDQSLDVAQKEIAKDGFTSVLGLWALRAQLLTPQQAKRVSELYFANIDAVDSPTRKAREFSVWHLTWAVADMFRLGDVEVRVELAKAYQDASKRVRDMRHNVAKRMFFGEPLVLGDIHFGGRAYARAHLVAPGNPKYLQSAADYEEN